MSCNTEKVFASLGYNLYFTKMRFNQPLFLFLMVINIISGQTSLQEINLANGPYSVGFRHYTTFDSTRTYTRLFDWKNNSVPRPILTSIWYPGQLVAPSAQQMDVLDYMEILKIEEEWEHLPNEQILNWFYYANTAENQKHLSEKTTAFSEIKAKEGKFPVVVYAPSYQAASIENFRLCEFLASHGYIVISSTSRGADGRFFEGGTPKDMETQARDVEFLMHQVKKIKSADTGRLAVMGFSFGGLSNMVAQMRNDNIKAVISLDGTERYQYPLLEKSPFFDFTKMDVPYLHMAQKDIPEKVLQEDGIDAELNSSFRLYDSISKSHAFQLKFHDLTHAYFSTLGVLFQTRDERQDKSDTKIMESYRWVSEYVLNFLDAYIKNKDQAKRFIENTPSANGIKNGLITSTSKPPKEKTFDFRDFNELALHQDYTNLFELYKVCKRNHTELEIPESALNNLGLQLVFNPETASQGIAIFQFATRLYPKSSNLYDSMAEGYLFLGKSEKAIESFEMALKLDANNQNAIKRLKELK